MDIHLAALTPSSLNNGLHEQIPLYSYFKALRASYRQNFLLYRLSNYIKSATYTLCQKIIELAMGPLKAFVVGRNVSPTLDSQGMIEFVNLLEITFSGKRFSIDVLCRPFSGFDKPWRWYTRFFHASVLIKIIV